MREYANGGKTKQEHYFDLKLCSGRNVIECAFGRLKARFGALRRQMDKYRKLAICHIYLLCFAQFL